MGNCGTKKGVEAAGVVEPARAMTLVEESSVSVKVATTLVEESSASVKVEAVAEQTVEAVAEQTAEGSTDLKAEIAEAVEKAEAKIAQVALEIKDEIVEVEDLAVFFAKFFCC